MNEEKETGRVEAFSDGVFAVAITLFVLDIKVPTLAANSPAQALGVALLKQWPAYLAYLTSFGTILIMWINHHRIFGLIRRTDDRFMLLNGLLLMAVCLTPFGTSLLATYALTPQLQMAAMVYSGACLFLAICFNLLWRYASKEGRLLAEGYNAVTAEGISRSYRYGPHAYLFAFVAAFFSAYVSIAVCMLLAIFFTIPPRKHVEVCGSKAVR